MLVIASLVQSLPSPLQLQAKFAGRKSHEFANRMLLPGRNNKVFRLFLLEHEPLHFDIVASVAPITLGVEISQIYRALQPYLYSRQPASNFTRDEGLSAHRGLVIKQNAVAGVHSVRFAIVDRDPVCEQLGYAIRRARMKWGVFI